MATWTTIPDSSLEPGKPIRSIDALSIRDNPVAITEGAVGAPRIAAAALQTGTPERDWVLARNADALTGAVGTYAFLGETTTTVTEPGGTRAGSGLRYAGVYKGNVTWSTNGGTFVYGTGSSSTPAGTWRCMGRSFGALSGGEDPAFYGATLWLRIA